MKMGILLDAYKRNLTNWQGTVKNRTGTELRDLLLRLILLFVILAAIIGSAELWRWSRITTTNTVTVGDAANASREIICTHVGAQHQKVNDSQRSTDNKE
jgi:hypothetical protein